MHEIFGIPINPISVDMIVSDLFLSLIISIWLKWIWVGWKNTKD